MIDRGGWGLRLEPDYIVIGGGSSGCVIVNRLSADLRTRVLLVEAGCSGESDRQVTTPGRWASLCGSKCDWNYALSICLAWAATFKTT